MQLIKYDPLKDLATIESDIEAMLRGGWGWIPETSSSAIDMYEEGGTLVTEIALPHFKKDEVQAKLTALA